MTCNYRRQREYQSRYDAIEASVSSDESRLMAAEEAHQRHTFDICRRIQDRAAIQWRIIELNRQVRERISMEGEEKLSKLYADDLRDELIAIELLQKERLSKWRKLHETKLRTALRCWARDTKV
jgi:hypothetical protein